MTNTKKHIILRGLTQTGEKFRPSDWAQRLTVAVSTIGPKKRIVRHSKVHMAIENGIPCVVIDPRLEEEDVMMFEFLIKFAKGNELQIENFRDDEEKNTTEETLKSA